MANQAQLDILKQGVETWNEWRELNKGESNIDIYVDLREANLSETHLHGANLIRAHLDAANLSGADLSQANLSFADLNVANLCKANLSSANLHGAYLWGTNLSEANLSNSVLDLANLMRADLTLANLTNADLAGATLIHTTVRGAKISGSSIYAVNVWDLIGEFEEQKDLIIATRGRPGIEEISESEPSITVDNIKIAQFIYLILNNAEIRNAINTLTSKSVLILGRFAIAERKVILDTLRNKLREYDLLPIVFDFDRPIDKDFTETIKTLAGLSYFVIADVTNPKSSPLELQATVPDYQIPFVPIIQEGEDPFAMMVDLQKKYDWVLKTVSYDSQETLMKVLKPLIIDPAMKKRQELRIIKAQEPEIISAKDYLAKGKE